MGFILLTLLYNEKKQIRLDEYKKCLHHNVNNPSIDKIDVFYEMDTEEDEMLKILKSYPNKVYIHYFNGRPTFMDFFKYCTYNYPKAKFVLTNADIYYDYNVGLNLLEEVDLHNKFLVLTRYNKLGQSEVYNRCNGIIISHKEGRLKTMHSNGCSVDSWIFATPLRLDFRCDIPLGILRCDSVMNFKLRRSRNYRVYNPCLDVISIHEHRGWTNAKYATVTVNGRTMPQHVWDNKCRSSGNNFDNIGFCRVKDIR